MAKAASKAPTKAEQKEELKAAQAELDANLADNPPLEPTEEPRKPEVSGKMTKAKATEVVNFYANVNVKGPTPKVLEEARKILSEK